MYRNGRKTFCARIHTDIGSTDVSNRLAATPYDRRLVEIAVAAGDACFDPEWDLLRVVAKDNPIHTRIVTGEAHNLVQSAYYALALLESADHAETTEATPVPAVAADERRRAEAILHRLVRLHDDDPASSTFGLWGYYAEESAREMVPADWNQADFHGRVLAFVLLRHADVLDPGLRDAVEAALGRAARSIVRRGVSMDYTNIAAKGTFVTLAAGQLLDDAELTAYGRERARRFAANLDRTGSVAEYVSPPYWAIAAEAFTAVGQYVVDPKARRVAAGVVDRLWHHLAHHWHAATGQVTGPMARMYVADVADQPGLTALLAKATGQAAPFDRYPLPDADVHLVVPAVVDPVLPAGLRDELLRPADHGTGRELFTRWTGGAEAREQAGGAEVAVVGTTWRAPQVTLGSVNQADTWLQRRNLLAFWAPPGEVPWSRPARSLRLRLLKDGQDFASGSFSSVQQDGAALWMLSLASPGGDRHLHLDTIDPGEVFAAGRIVARLELAGVPDAEVRVDGAPAVAGAVVPEGSTVTVRTDGVEIALRHLGGALAGRPVTARWVSSGGAEAALEVELDLAGVRADDDPGAVRLRPGVEAWLAGLVTIRPPTEAPVGGAATASRDGDAVHAAWRPVGGGPDLELVACAVIGTRAQHGAELVTRVGGEPPPVPRLSDYPLV